MVLVQQTVVQMKSTQAFSYDSLILNWTFFSKSISSVKYYKNEFHKPNNLFLLLFWKWPRLNIQTCTVILTDHFRFFHFKDFVSINCTLNGIRSHYITHCNTPWSCTCKKLKFTTEFNRIFGCTRKEEFCAKFMCTQLQRLLTGANKYIDEVQIMNTYIIQFIYFIYISICSNTHIYMS